MSRTDKDRPYWVRVNDKRDKQRRGVEHLHTGWRGSVRDCDEHVLCSGHDYRTTNCTPYLDYHIYATSPQRSACATEWHRQERAGQRVIKRNLTRAANSGWVEDAEDLIDNCQTHVGAYYHGGYWD